MLAKRIIPCLDVAEGRVVKGTNFVNLKDAGDPVELAVHYNNQGADELVFLDITASSDKRTTLLHLVKEVAKKLFIPFTVGGGINDISIISDVLYAGADKVSINTAAVKNPNLIDQASKRFGAQCIVTAIDAKRIKAHSNCTYPILEVQVDSESKWEVFTHGGRHPTGIDAVKWASFLNKKGAGEILLTSMDADGTKAGYDIELTAAVSKAVNIPVIASGGAGNTQHIVDALNVCDAALLASLLHFKELTIDEIKSKAKQANLQIR
ncbi:imidazole glycerol phosphate synthase subunit HisF [Candidatus Marinamargulisbacteria bacterium SCGC AAA071-K20]|nr:imidazole glycerol phosphate synthase subunit HisF [Candidatus Marinamargulisbacteria bacterium SCGC AAA071-K20]